MPVPVEVQASLIKKIVTFDRNMSAKSGSSFNILILYQKDFKTSLNAKNKIEKALSGGLISEFSDAPIKVFSFALDSDTDLKNEIMAHRIVAIYVAPLRAYDIDDISAISRAKKIVTFTGVPEYVDKGLAVGIDVKGDKPEIVVNLNAAKAEGADFSSQLLKMVRIIK